MSWRVEYTKRFLKEMSRLPPKARERAEKIAFEELPSGNPFELGSVERMTDYPKKYKIRFGEYRMGIDRFEGQTGDLPARRESQGYLQGLPLVG